MPREPKNSEPTLSPNKAGHAFRGRLFGGTLFGVLLVFLIAWICLLSFGAWHAVASLFG